MKFLFFLLISFFPCANAIADDFICNPQKEWCPDRGHRSSTAPAYPSKSSRININPSAVPIEKGTGIEVIGYRDTFDFSIVKGTGRVGAAISPTNSEETFFGPPGFEYDSDFLDRKINGKKYESQKVTLAAAFSLFNNKKKGLKTFEVSVGLMGKYNKLSKQTNPGVGLSGALGPVTFGYAYANDEFIIDPQGLNLQYKYAAETKSIGVRVGTLVLDYSQLRIILPEAYAGTNPPAFTITLLTTSLLFKRVLLTYSARTEDSPRLAYNKATKLLEVKQYKTETFGGIQLVVSKNLLLGAFYNYYLLNETSFGGTLFF